MMPASLSRLSRAASDRGVLWGLAHKFWTGLSGVVTVALITYAFTPELQGYHYAFLSLLGLQVFVELGLSTVLAVYASHEWSALRLDASGAIEGERAARSRLASVLRFGLRWFAVGTMAMGIGLALAGILFFSNTHQQAPEVAWRAPWVVLCAATAINLLFVPVWAILSGCNQVGELNFYRLVESFVRSVVLWLALVSGAGLWSAAIAAAMGLPCAAGWLVWRYGRFFGSLLHEPIAERVRWREMLPMQWRIAVSWLAGYFSFSLFVPALFWFQGAVVAGQMGMTWTIVGAISNLAQTWLQVKTPQFGIFVVQKDFAGLDKLIQETRWISVAAAGAGGIAFLVLLLVLDEIAPGLRTRLLPTAPVLILSLAEALHQISIVQSAALRAFKEEPFFRLGVTSALIIGGGTIVCAKFFGATGVTLSYLLAIVVAWIWGSRILGERRREWARAA
jgi:hypothetical protein